MAREFTVNIPDELWVDSWEDGLTATYTYPGPDSIWLEIDHTSKHLYNVSVTKPDQEYIDAVNENSSNVQIEEFVVNSDETALTAHLLLRQATDYNLDEEYTWEYVYAEETQYDGSVYQKITNPEAHDVYFIEVGKAGSDTISVHPKIKDPETRLEILATRRLKYLESFTSSFDFSDEPAMQATIDALNEFIESLATVYPWKFVTLDENTIPKIPYALATVLSELPSNLGE